MTTAAPRPPSNPAWLKHCSSLLATQGARVASSGAAVDSDRECVIDLLHALIGEAPEALHEHACGDALDGVEVRWRRGGGPGPRRALGGLRSRVRGSWSCRALRVRVQGVGWRRFVTARRSAVGRCQGVRTTRSRPWPAGRSRGAGALAKRRQIAPLVLLVERLLVVGGVARVELGCPGTSFVRTAAGAGESHVWLSRPASSRRCSARGRHRAGCERRCGRRERSRRACVTRRPAARPGWL